MELYAQAQGVWVAKELLDKVVILLIELKLHVRMNFSSFCFILGHSMFPNTHAHAHQPVPTPISLLSSVSQLKCHFLPEDFYSCPTPSGTHGSLKFPKTFQVMTILYSYLLQLPMVQPKCLPVEAWGSCGFVSEDCPLTCVLSVKRGF